MDPKKPKNNEELDPEYEAELLALLARLGPQEPDDGAPDGSDGQEEEDYSPPRYGWKRTPDGKIQQF